MSIVLVCGVLWLWLVLAAWAALRVHARRGGER